MGLAAGWLWVVLAMASGTPPDPSAEAVCGLSALHTAEQAFFAEKDRHDLPAAVGFRPLPCPDGTRPPAPDSHSVGGCRFVFTVLEAGHAPDTTLKLEARGVAPDTQGLHFLLDGRDAYVTRAGSDARVAPVDCEAWRQAADPLARYHDLVAKYGCVAGPYVPEDPCTEALTQLVKLARQGVGVARMEYAAHPTARELYPLSPPTPAMLLCGVTATPQQRVRLVEQLARQNQLLDTILAPSCRAEGLRVALPYLFQEGACPGPQCLALMSLAQGIRLPERTRILEGRAAPMARWLWDQPATLQRDFLSRAVNLPGDRVEALLSLRKGDWPSLQPLMGSPFTPLENAWFDLARREQPSLSPLQDILGELQDQGTASAAGFKLWTEGTPCSEFEYATYMAMSTERLLALSNAEARCPGEPLSILSRHVKQLPPKELIAVLKPLSAEQLLVLRRDLGLFIDLRAEALFDWVMEREPRLLDGFAATPAVVTKLLTPPHVNRLGGREAVLDLLLDPQRITPTYDALLIVMAEALKGTPSAARVRNVAGRYLLPEDRRRLLSGILRAPAPHLQAAAAAGVTVYMEPSDIPAPAARACLAEARLTLECMAARSRPLGPPPPAPIEAYCTRFEAKVAPCPTACGGALLGPNELALLATVADAPPPTPPDALRACNGSYR